MPFFFNARLRHAIDKNDAIAAARLLQGRTFEGLEGYAIGEYAMGEREVVPWIQRAFYDNAWRVFPLLVPDITNADEKTCGQVLLRLVDFIRSCGQDPDARRVTHQMVHTLAAQRGSLDALSAMLVPSGISTRARAMSGVSKIPLDPIPFQDRVEIEVPGLMMVFFQESLEKAVPPADPAVQVRKSPRI
jgi:hypothetical protein